MASILFKEGVGLTYDSSMSSVSMQVIWNIMGAAARIWKLYGETAVVTALMDGKHKTNSKHYEGLAVDLRTRYFSAETTSIVASLMRKDLGPDYDVVVEPTHIHVEYDPKNG